MKTSQKIGNLTLLLSFMAITSCSNDDGCATKTFYQDSDSDGFGNAAVSKSACSRPTGFVANNTDTNDTDDLIFPGCSERTFYFDKDKDGFGDSNATEIGCIERPDGYVEIGGDCDDTDATIKPDVMITYYEDLDGDGFGNEEKSQQVSICEAEPENHTKNDSAFDCDDTNKSVNPDSLFLYYFDADGDGYGNPAITREELGCRTDIENYVANKDDCNDNFASINPGEDEIAGDGLDNNCDGFSGFVWDGPDIVFSKATKVDWTATKNQDKLTENVIFTRQEAGPMYNFAWWSHPDNFNEDAIHIDDNNSDLIADFDDDASAAIKDINTIAPSGGTKNVRWALLDDTGSNGHEAWADFNLYGTLGDPTNFYSFHNIASIIYYLEEEELHTSSVKDDFEVIVEGVGTQSTTDFSHVIGKKLGAWLVEDDIYLTLTFTEWEEGNGGAFSYTRSTPTN